MEPEGGPRSAGQGTPSAYRLKSRGGRWERGASGLFPHDMVAGKFRPPTMATSS